MTRVLADPEAFLSTLVRGGLPAAVSVGTEAPATMARPFVFLEIRPGAPVADIAAIAVTVDVHVFGDALPADTARKAASDLCEDVRQLLYGAWLAQSKTSGAAISSYRCVVHGQRLPAATDAAIRYRSSFQLVIR